MGAKSKSLELRASTPTKRSAGVPSLPVYFQFEIIAEEFMEAFDDVVIRELPTSPDLVPCVKEFLAEIDAFDRAHTEPVRWSRRDLCDKRKERQISYEFVAEKIGDLVEAFGNARTQVVHMGFLIADVMRANPTPVALETACIRYRHAKVFPPSAIAELLEFLREAEEHWIHRRDILGGLIEIVERRKAIAEARSRQLLTSNQPGTG
jgi:hypothetical protein